MLETQQFPTGWPPTHMIWQYNESLYNVNIHVPKYKIIVRCREKSNFESSVCGCADVENQCYSLHSTQYTNVCLSFM